MVEKLQKPKIVIADDDNGQVPQPQKTPKHIPPRDPKTGRFVKIHSDRPKPPKQPTLPRLRDAEGRFISRRQSELVVQQPLIQIRGNQKAQKPIGKPVPAKPVPAKPVPAKPVPAKPVPAPTIKNRAPKIESWIKLLRAWLNDNNVA